MNTLVEWSEFKKRLTPQPNKRTGRKWVEECGVIGRVIVYPNGEYEVWIDPFAFDRGDTQNELDARALALVS